MSDYQKEYAWYNIGCLRLNRDPLGYDEFAIRWSEMEAHALVLKSSNEEGTLGALDAARRLEMQQRFNDDPFVRAVLVGMAEDNSSA